MLYSANAYCHFVLKQHRGILCISFSTCIAKKYVTYMLAMLKCEVYFFQILLFSMSMTTPPFSVALTDNRNFVFKIQRNHCDIYKSDSWDATVDSKLMLQTFCKYWEKISSVGARDTKIFPNYYKDCIHVFTTIVETIDVIVAVLHSKEQTTACMHLCSLTMKFPIETQQYLFCLGKYHAQASSKTSVVKLSHNTNTQCGPLRLPNTLIANSPAPSASKMLVSKVVRL